MPKETFPQYFVCHAGDGSDPNAEMGFIGRVYIWEGDWLSSPEEVSNSERNAEMKLYPIYGERFEVRGDLGCFTPVFFNPDDAPASPVV